jgi:hypothetical protein
LEVCSIHAARIAEGLRDRVPDPDIVACPWNAVRSSGGDSDHARLAGVKEQGAPRIGFQFPDIGPRPSLHAGVVDERDKPFGRCGESPAVLPQKVKRHEERAQIRCRDLHTVRFGSRRGGLGLDQQSLPGSEEHGQREENRQRAP